MNPLILHRRAAGAFAVFLFTTTFSGLGCTQIRSDRIQPSESKPLDRFGSHDGPNGKNSIVGTVTDSRSHEPISGARITLSAIKLDPATNAPVPFEGAPNYGVRGEAQTDAAGCYRFYELPDGMYFLEIAPRADHAVTTDYSRKTASLAGGQVLTLEWKIEHAVQVLGEIRDSGGRPLGNIPLTVEVWNSKDDPKTMTDTNGKFSAWVPSRCDVSFRVSANGEASDELDRHSIKGEDVSGLIVALRKSLSISGTVIQAGNRPMSRARVEFEPGRTVTTDDRGRFTVDEISPGRHSVAVVPADTSSGRRQHIMEIDVMPGVPREDLVLYYNPGADNSIIGHVTDLTGRPLAGAMLYWVRSDQQKTESAIADPDGSYILHDLAPGVYLLSNIIVEGRPYGQNRTIRGLRRASPGASNVNFRVDLELPPEPEKLAEIRVLSAMSGEPIQNFTYVFVEFRGSAQPGDETSPYRILAQHPRKEANDTVGRLNVGMRPNSKYGLAVTAIGYATWMDYVHFSDDPLIVTLQPELRILGRALDPNGQPIAGATIVYDRIFDEIVPERDTFGYLGVTDRDGRFEIGAMPSRPIPITIVHDDFVPLRVTAKAERSRATQEFWLRRAGVLRGVIYVDDKPCADGYVQVVDQVKFERHGVGNRTDVAGNYRSSRLRISHSKVHVTIFDTIPAKRQQQDIEIDIAEGADFKLDFHFVSK